MDKKNAFVDLRNEVRDLKRMFIEIQEKMSPTFYDPIDYIKLKDDLIVVLKFRGVYFTAERANTLSKALGRTGINCDSRMLKRLIEDRDRWSELWAMGVETHYMKLTNVGKWLCSDGNVLRKNLTAYRTNKHNSFVEFDVDGDIYNINRAKQVFKYFIDPDIEDDDIYWKDGDFRNCCVSNIRHKDREIFE